MESWRRNRLVFWVVSLPPSVWLAAFFLVPLALIWVLSFGEKRGEVISGTGAGGALELETVAGEVYFIRVSGAEPGQYVLDLFNLGPDDPTRDTIPPRLPGDSDGDGDVDSDDFLTLSANYARTDAVFADGDFDANGTVGFNDFLILSANFGKKLLTT